MKHFHWMVFDRIDRFGIWFYGTKDHMPYVWYWNPLRMFKIWFIYKNWSFGWFPMSKKHINFNDKKQ